MLRFKMDNEEVIKKYLIEQMSTAVGAEVVMKMQDRVIVADLVVNAVRSTLENLCAHSERAEKVIGPELTMAMIILMLQHTREAVEAMQRGVTEQITRTLFTEVFNASDLAAHAERFGLTPEEVAAVEALFSTKGAPH